MKRDQMMTFNLITFENLMDINEQIKIRALIDSRIEYTGIEDYPIKVYHLKKLIELAPKSSTIIEIAAYYLKNIILLQAFPDANHRTALIATERFLEKNNYKFSYLAIDAFQFQKELYNKRLYEYGTYEERPISILKEEENQVYSLCYNFIVTHVEQNPR